MKKTIRTPVEILEELPLEDQIQILHEIRAISETGIVGKKTQEVAKKIESEIRQGVDFGLWYDTIEKKIPLILALKFAPKLEN